MDKSFPYLSNDLNNASADNSSQALANQHPEATNSKDYLHSSNRLNNNSSGTFVTNSPTEGKKELTARLISGLNNILESWALTPVDGKKCPYRLDWQKEEPLSRDTIAFQQGVTRNLINKLGVT